MTSDFTSEDLKVLTPTRTVDGAPPPRGGSRGRPEQLPASVLLAVLKDSPAQLTVGSLAERCEVSRQTIRTKLEQLERASAIQVTPWMDGKQHRGISVEILTK